jgi:hypothetical protein
MEPDLAHDIVEQRHDRDPAQPVTLLQLGKQRRREISAAFLTAINLILFSISSDIYLFN